MTGSLPWIALVLGIIAAVWAATAHARLRIADDLRDDSADWLGVGSDSFPHAQDKY